MSSVAVLVLAICSAVVSPTLIWWAGETAIRSRRQKHLRSVSEWIAADVHSAAHASDGNAGVPVAVLESVTADLMRIEIGRAHV